MAIKLKAVETLQSIGMYQGEYRYVLRTELYNQLTTSKVLQTASASSGINRGMLQAAWDAIGEAIRTWATEGHSVPIPGLGTMRFGVSAQSVASAEEVGTKLIKSRKVVFTPSVEIKNELKNTAINITCYDRNGNVVKQTSSSSSNVDDSEGDNVQKGVINLTANPANGGTVQGSGTYDKGTEITIKAVAGAGYAFTRWSDGNTDAQRTITVEGNLDLTAQFTKDGGEMGDNVGGEGDSAF